MNNNSPNISRAFIAVSLIVVNLIGQIYFKHFLNDIPLTAINFLSLGNIFNILINGLIILGILLIQIVNRGLDKKEYGLILFVVIIALLSYASGLFIAKTDYIHLDSYFFGTPARKVYLSIVFLINLYTHFYLLSYIWSILIGRQTGGAGKAFGGAVLGIILAMAFSYWFVIDKDNHVDAESIDEPYDIGVILGAAVWSNNEPSTIFKRRIDKGRELLSKFKLRKLQLTGGSVPGELTEAEAARKYLLSKGVNSSLIKIEEETSTTSQQVQFIKDELLTDDKIDRVVVISDQFHLARVLEMAKFYNLDIDGIASDYKLRTDKIIYYTIRESVALLLFWLFAI